MIPLELKRDIDGLLYTSDKNLLKRPPLLIDHRMDGSRKRNAYYFK